ncbi:MAG: DUF3443 family protein [Candidatus Competibacter sp.]
MVEIRATQYSQRRLVSAVTANRETAPTVSSTVTFGIANALTLFDSSNTAFNNLGGPNPANPTLGFVGGFDYGLPFFFDRDVYMAIENQSTPAGEGPFWAY